MPDVLPPTKTPLTTQRIFWLVGSLVVGYLVGNIMFMLPFAAILYFLVPDTRFNARWIWWRKLAMPWRAVMTVVAMYIFVFVFMISFAPWLTSGMGS